MRIKNRWFFLAFVMAMSVVFAAPSVYATGIDGGYVGEDVCLNCHTDKASYLKSGHPYKLRLTGGKTPVAVVTDPATQVLDPLSALLTMPKVGDLLDPNNLTGRKVDDGSGRLDWSAVEYVVGGFGQKARWGLRDTVDGSATGYIWSNTVIGAGGTSAQWNMLAADTTLDSAGKRSDWSTYGSATKGYHCAVCHNTNGTTSNTADTGCVTPLNSGRTEPWASTGKVYTSPGGFKSEWSLTGVQCEACHGKGSNVSGNGHADGSGTQGVLTLAGGVEICAKCHIRAGNASFGSECGGDTSEAILNGGACIGANCTGTGPVGHHEQYNEMMGVKDSTTGNQFDGVHASLKCTTCHDPHKRATKVTSAIAGVLGISTAGNANLRPEVGAIRKQCSDCHFGKETAKTTAMTAAHAGVTCVDCHMGEATQTATSVSGTTWGKKGDLKTHVFKINPGASAVHYRNNAAGKTVAANAMPIEYSCGKCHDATLAESYSGYAIASKADASVLATGYHNTIASVDGGYVGSEVCGSCHTAKYDDFVKTGHPYKMRFTFGKTPYDNGSCEPGTISGGIICDPLSVLLTMPKTADLLNPNGSLTAKVSDSEGRLDWSAVQYVIGGFGQKARWGVLDSGNTATGYIWSQTSGGQPGGTNAQWNMLAADPTLDTANARADWSTYGGVTKQYHCAVCHHTNGTTSKDAGCTTALGSGRSEPWATTGLTTTTAPGFASEWSLTGVQCEACHGKGLNHVTAASTSNIDVNDSKDACGKCHTRSGNSTHNGVATFGSECGGDTQDHLGNTPILNNGACMGADCQGTGMIGHHEQYGELYGVNGDGVHASLDCVTCHDPHKRSTKVTSAIAGGLGITDNNLSGEARGAVVSCQSCHAPAASGATTKISATAHPAIACIDCHMAEAAQTATTANGTWGKVGDLKTHMVKIDPAATQIYRTITVAPNVTKKVAANALTVNFACGKCHDSNPNLAATYSGFALTVDQARAAAANIHGGATSDCKACHSAPWHPMGTGNPYPSCTTCHTTHHQGATVLINVCKSCHGQFTDSQLTELAAGIHALNTYTITVSQTPNGSITPYTYSSFHPGADQTYSITPNTGYKIESLTVDGNTVAVAGTYTFTNIHANHTITATFASNSTATITATAGPNGSISPSGSLSVLSGTNKTYTITPDSGYRISQVLVDGVSKGTVTSYTFVNITPGEHTISATFVKNEYTITASVIKGSGSISPPGVTTVNGGGSQSYSFTPASGYKVSNVTVNGATVKLASDGTYTFNNVKSNYTIGVSFVPVTYTITVTQTANGSITPYTYSGFQAGANQTYSITPKAGYHIESLTVDGSPVAVASTYTFTDIRENHTITATYAANPSAMITAAPSANGTISPSGSVSVLSGTNKTFYITPDSGYRIAQVVVDGVSKGTVTSYTFVNITPGEHTITATFSLIQ